MNVQTAFILGAGLGTRLRPLTDSRPKVLLPIFGQPLLFLTLDYLLSYGITRFVINTHHLPNVFNRFFGGYDGEFSYRGYPVRLVYEPVLLETAGGLRNVRQWVGGDPFLVVNGDILTNISLLDLFKLQKEEEACVILGLRSGPPQVGMELRTNSVLDFYKKLGRKGLSYFLFASLYIVRPEIYHWIPEQGSVSMMSIFWKLLHAGERIAGTVLNSGFWNEVGDRASYFQVHRDLAPSIKQHFKSPVPADVELRGICTVGENCEIGAGAILEDTIIWDGAKIGPRSHLKRCIVCDGAQVDGDFTDRDFCYAA